MCQRFIILVVIAASCTAAGGAADLKPHTVVGKDGLPVLVLPKSLRAAMRRYNSKMRFPQWSEYSDGVRSYFRRQHPRAVPWAVWGDFNGDGRTDVALDLQSRDHCIQKFVIYHQLNNRSWEPHLLRQFVATPTTPIERAADGFIILRRGRQHVTCYGCDPKQPHQWGPMWLQHDAIETVFLDAAASLTFWEDDKYVSVITD